MGNWINLSDLPRNKKGNISWKDCHNNIVEFNYEGLQSNFIIIKRLQRKELLILFEDREYTINPDSLLKCKLSSFVRYAKVFCDGDVKTTVNDVSKTPDCEYLYSVGDTILFNNKNIVIKQRLKIRDIFLAYECIYDGKNYIITNYALKNNLISIYIRKNGIVIGVNDLWTTCSEVATMLNNPEEGFLYKKNSNHKCLFRCPRCNRVVGYKLISYVTRTYSVSCPYCGDGISYPNKLMANLLDYLKVPFKTECFFDWCVYASFKDKTQLDIGYYDFVIETMHLIIEMDGGIGHGNNVYTNSGISKEESLYRDLIKDELALTHGYNIIRVNCNYTSINRLEHCKKAIEDSISHLFDLSEVDWDLLDKRSQNSYFIDAINLYRQGFSPLEISVKLGRDYTCILNYLHRGDELGMCKYFPYTAYKKII